MTDKLALYFGCLGKGSGGHRLSLPDNGFFRRERDFPTLPWSDGMMDTGLLQNGKHEDKIDGRVFWTCGGRQEFWYAFYWWDRSGDSRANSNSGFYVKGFGPAVLTPETARENAALAFAYACSVWPKIVERQRVPLRLQP